MRVSSHPDRDRKRTRLKDFDYSSDGAYFITVCTANRENIFGEIRDEKMILNNHGKIAQKCWREIPIHFPRARIAEFVVMPNHVHGIVWIDNWKKVGNGHARSLRNSLQIKSNLSAIVGSFKSAVSKIIRHQNSALHSVWQKSFFDRVIRDDGELNRVRDYISLNPENWEKDENNLGGLLR